MILSVTLNPSIDHTIFVPELRVSDTNRVERTEIDAGGKGVNLSRIAVEVGGESTATGFLGGATGHMVEGVLRKQGVVSDFVHTRAKTRTNVSIETGSKAPPTTLNEKGGPIRPEEWEQLLSKVDRLMEGAAWLAMGGSLPQGLGADAFLILGQRARALGVPVLIDADGEPMKHALTLAPDMVKPNEKEAARLLGRPIATDDDALQAAEELYARLNDSPNRVALVSRGRSGAVMRCSEGLFLGRAADVESCSTIGSGDSLLGGLLAKRIAGCTWSEAFRWGLAAGSATAITNGAEIGRRADIERLVAESTVTAARL